jgi:hypothetical protein
LNKMSIGFLYKQQWLHLLDLPEDTGILGDTHAKKFLTSPVFI